MSRTFVVTMGEQEYTLHPFNIGELEEVGDILQNTSPVKAGYAILRVAMRRASPAIPDPNALEITQAEIVTVINALMVAAGLAPAPPAPGEARPAG